MLANLRHASSTGKGAYLTPAECAEAAEQLDRANRMEDLLREVLPFIDGHRVNSAHIVDLITTLLRIPK